MHIHDQLNERLLLLISMIIKLYFLYSYKYLHLGVLAYSWKIMNILFLFKQLCFNLWHIHCTTCFIHSTELIQMLGWIINLSYKREVKLSISAHLHSEQENKTPISILITKNMAFVKLVEHIAESFCDCDCKLDFSRILESVHVIFHSAVRSWVNYKKWIPYSRNQCEQMRTLLAKRLTKEIVQDWGEQIKMKQRLECEEEENERMYAYLVKVDVDNKVRTDIFLLRFVSPVAIWQKQFYIRWRDTFDRFRLKFKYEYWRIFIIPNHSWSEKKRTTAWGLKRPEKG